MATAQGTGDLVDAAAKRQSAAIEKLVAAFAAVDDLAFPFSIVELCELLEHGCLVVAAADSGQPLSLRSDEDIVRDGALQASHEALVSQICSQLQQQGMVVVRNLATALSSDDDAEMAGVDGIAKLVHIALGR